MFRIANVGKRAVRPAVRAYHANVHDHYDNRMCIIIIIISS
jgi:hypothetical protein